MVSISNFQLPIADFFLFPVSINWEFAIGNWQY